MSFIPKINAVLNIQAFSHSMTKKVDTNNTQLQNKSIKQDKPGQLWSLPLFFGYAIFRTVSLSLLSRHGGSSS